MKKLLIIPIILLALLLVGCSWVQPFIPTPDPVVELSANVVIVDWEQECESECGDVTIYYKITNTGTVDIDYYTILFQVICEDGSIYGDWVSGTDVDVGDYEFTDCNVDVSADEAIRVEVTDWELTHWEL